MAMARDTDKKHTHILGFGTKTEQKHVTIKLHV